MAGLPFRDMWANVSFLVARSVLGVLGLGPTPDANDAEIAVVYRLSILHRHFTQTPHYSHADNPSVLIRPANP